MRRSWRGRREDELEGGRERVEGERERREVKYDGDSVVEEGEAGEAIVGEERPSSVILRRDG